MIKLTDEMRRWINQARANETPCIMATASPDGVPNAGFKGTMVVLDEAALAYRERGEPSAVRQLEENPKVVIRFRNPSQNVGWKFRCTAAVYRDGPVFQRVMDQLVAEGLLSNADGTGTAVVLQVDQVLTLYGEVLQERVTNLNWYPALAGGLWVDSLEENVILLGYLGWAPITTYSGLKRPWGLTRNPYFP